ncbi:MAG: hypothetical protein ABSG57_12165 [Candidatus Bathyarchaeia archaeon]
MYSRILTAVERKKIRTYLKTNGKRDSTIRVFVSRARRYRAQIQSDLRLMEELVTKYEKTRKVIQVRVRH